MDQSWDIKQSKNGQISLCLQWSPSAAPPTPKRRSPSSKAHSLRRAEQFKRQLSHQNIKEESTQSIGSTEQELTEPHQNPEPSNIKEEQSIDSTESTPDCELQQNQHKPSVPLKEPLKQEPTNTISLNPTDNQNPISNPESSDGEDTDEENTYKFYRFRKNGLPSFG